MSLKIKPAHYAILESACKRVLAENPGVALRYAAAGESNMRLNFDVFYAAWTSEDRKERVYQWACRELYSYLNDVHISSALAAIMGNDGLNGKGKR